MTTDSNSNGRENQPRRAGRPSKLTPELEKTILLAIAEGGCTYVDACLIAGIGQSTFHKWKLQGQAARSGLFREFVDKLKRAEADFRAHHLKKIQDAANESSVETRKTTRTAGDGDDQKMTFQEVVEITRPPTWTASAWLLERKYPEQYSLKHLDVTARVTNTEPPPPMHLVIVDPVKQGEDAEADALLTRLST